MFDYVRQALNKSNRKLPAQQAALLVAASVLLAGIISAVFLASLIARQAYEDYQTSLGQRNASIRLRLEGSIDGYSQVLHAGATLFNLKGDVNSDVWHEFYHGMKIEESLPGTLGIGYVTYIEPNGVSAFEERIRAEGYQNFTVSPANQRSEYTAITYLEPNTDSNNKALGYDMFSEAQRNKAMSAARDSATVAISAPVSLVQDQLSTTPGEFSKGILMYYPVYQTRDIPATVQERRDSLRGYVYIVMRPADTLDAHLKANPQVSEGVDVTLLDTTGNEVAELSKVSFAQGSSGLDQAVENTFSVRNRQWQVRVAGSNSALNSAILPFVVITAGIIISTVVSALMLNILIKRIDKVERSYEAEVEKTKDELLSLASHQLRTPASGVKQYIGILTAGIVGELTPAQQQIAEKAYKTNERQIEIINQLLYVSKIEAGKIIIHPERSNMTAIVQRLIDQLRPSAERKNIEIVFKAKQARYIFGDEQYYPMIIDNLINNAIKYSYPGTSVVVRLFQYDGFIGLSVSDKGVGISTDDRSQLFKKFNRIENPLSRSEGGSGLGLFLAYQLARAHGGDIEVNSALGKGSTFTLYMPKTHQVNEALVDIYEDTNSALKS